MFENRQFGDRLWGRRLWLCGLLLVTCTLLALSVGNGVARADSVPTGLVLWNKLGSAQEVLHSAYGPNLAFFDPSQDCLVADCTVAYKANTEYVPGVFGNALSIGPGDYGQFGVGRVHNVVLRNVANYVNTEHGAVEAWFKETAPGIPYQFGDYRVFDGAYGFSPGIAFGNNAITNNNHFVFEFALLFGGSDVEVKSLSTGELGYDISAYDGQWIHLAGVWDRQGIAGTTDTMRLYVNGQVVATATENDWGMSVGPLADIGGGNADDIADKFAMDNLKLWNIAKTDFSDRFTEGFGQEVGLDVAPQKPNKVLNLKSNAQLDVAILSSSSFDARTVDATSVRLGPANAAPRKNGGKLRDVNGDNRDDLILSFKIQDLGLKAGDTQLCFTGSTVNGTLIHGCDAIKTRP